MASNNPRHGDAIIKPVKDAFGNTKLVADGQFQRFLDELSDLVLEDTDSTDADQIIEATNAAFQAKLNSLVGIVNRLGDGVQEIQILQGEISRLQALVREQKQVINDSLQELNELRATIPGLLSQIREHESEINDLEQLANGN
jgi:chromosome segregation ATPase